MRQRWLANVALALAFAAPAAAPAAAQSARSLPDYAPLNPTMAARTGLSTFGYRDPVPGWRTAFAAEYGSAIELDEYGASFYLLDAELYRVQAAVSRDVGTAEFVVLQAGVTGAHAGFADAFFDEFHRLISHRHGARDARPRNGYAYVIDVAGHERIEHAPAPPALSDIRAVVGRRHGAGAQSVLALTLPTSTAPAGHRRGVPSLALINTLRLPLGPRLSAEGSLGVGYTPRHGPLAPVQRVGALSGSAGVRIRAVGEHAVYGLLFYHSPIHDVAHLPELAGGELVTEFGVLLATRGGREWRIGLVEDTRLVDAGIDLILKLSTARGGAR